eukprot:1917512-Pleurochrysis_carterae.AAC.1
MRLQQTSDEGKMVGPVKAENAGEVREPHLKEGGALSSGQNACSLQLALKTVHRESRRFEAKYFGCAASDPHASRLRSTFARIEHISGASPSAARVSTRTDAFDSTRRGARVRAHACASTRQHSCATVRTASHGCARLHTGAHGFTR